MKRKKLYIITAFLIAVVIFDNAAICNQCSIEATSATTEKVEVESTAATETTSAQNISETTVNAVGTTLAQEQQQNIYTNTQYGFSFSLPLSWEGYQIIESKWEGYTPGSQGDVAVEQGPIISIRHPEWTLANPRQDIPIMVFTLAQWDSLQQDKFHIGAAPIGPSELGNNTKYVFALPARYNFSFLTGYEEVEKILEGNPLKAS
jgi:hypothetical protein